MSYTSWSVVFGEQPSAAKWNILGTNDASFNDGTGIAGLYKNLLTVDSNPYKFRAYRNSSLTLTSGAFTKMPLDAESYDTNGNFDSTTNYRYTAPVSGFYHFDARFSTSTTRCIAALYKNGSEILRGDDQTVSSSPVGVGVSGDLQLSASDYVEFYYFSQGATSLDVGSVSTWFSGHLISRT